MAILEVSQHRSLEFSNESAEGSTFLKPPKFFAGLALVPAEDFGQKGTQISVNT